MKQKKLTMELKREIAKALIKGRCKVDTVVKQFEVTEIQVLKVAQAIDYKIES